MSVNQLACKLLTNSSKSLSILRTFGFQNIKLTIMSSCAVKSCQYENFKLFKCSESSSQLKKWKNVLNTSERNFYVC